MPMRALPWLVSDGLWKRLEPLLPARQRRFRYPGRRPFDDRAVRLNMLARINALLPASGQLDDARADKRPSVPLSALKACCTLRLYSPSWLTFYFSWGAKCVMIHHRRINFNL